MGLISYSGLEVFGYMTCFFQKVFQRNMTASEDSKSSITEWTESKMQGESLTNDEMLPQRFIDLVEKSHNVNGTLLFCYKQALFYSNLSNSYSTCLSSKIVVFVIFNPTTH